MPNLLHDSRNHSHFNSRWTHVTDPAQVATILAGISVPAAGYNQLMVAPDPNGAYYAVYGAQATEERHGLFGGVFEKPAPATGKPIEATPGTPIVGTPAAPTARIDPNAKYVKLYDRGDYPANYE